MKREKIFLTLFFLLGLVWTSVVEGARPPQRKSVPPPSRPESGDLLNLDWRVYIAAKPIYCILVEKDRQRLRVLRHDGRIQVVAEYAAATGENAGPKEKEGDGKTPEGIYFITKGYLDRKVSVFGTRAFHLNYPNYFDLRAGRAGNGIYIHGTNKTLRFNSSNGCVTLKNRDLDRLADFLTVGTPVFIVQSLAGAKGEDTGTYPNLTERNFDGAKSLLFPEVAAGQTDFASLYLIRINGQTVAVGEYWVGPSIASPQLTVAYLQSGTENRWSVVDRGPVASGQETAGLAATIEGLPLELRLQDATLEVDDSSWAEGDSLPWQVSLDDIYLSWYREVGGAGPPSLLGPEGFDPTRASLKGQERGPRTGLVYGLFFLASCISIGSALVVIRRQFKRQGDEIWRLAAPQGEGMGHQAPRVEEQVALLRTEVKQAMGTLRTVHKRIDEEAMNVESLEALQARMKALEGAFYAKQEEIDQLSAEQAAIKRQGMEENSDHAEALGVLQQELVEVKRQLDAARHDMMTVAEREGTVHDQVAEIRRLLEKDMLSKEDAELREIAAVCNGLQGQVQLMAESLQRVETTRLHDLEEAGMDDAVAEALQGYAAEMKALHSEVAALKGAAETTSSGLEAVVQGLRDELRQEQASKLELTERLGRLSGLEEALAGERRQHEAWRQGSETRQAELTAEKRALESSLAALREELDQAQGARSEMTSRLERMGEIESEKVVLQLALDSLRQELHEAQGANSDLVSQLARINELEVELAGRDQEHEVLRRAGDERYAELESEKTALEVTLDALRQELREAQGENSDLANQLERINELEEELSWRNNDLESLRKASDERQAELESAKMALDASLAALREEFARAQDANAELRGRAERMDELKAELSRREEQQIQVESEKAALKVALDSLRRELSEAQGANSDLTGQLVRINELEEELARRDRELELLRKEGDEHQAQLEVAKRESDASLAALGEELAQERNARAGLVSRIEQMEESKVELSRRNHEEKERNAELEAETTALKVELDSLRQELSEAQGANSDLSTQLVRINELEEELTRRDREHELWRKKSEERQAELEAAKMELVSSLTGLREELIQTQDAKAELTSRVERMDELKAELSHREHEYQVVLRAGEQRDAELESEKAAMQVTLDSLRQELNEAQGTNSDLSSQLGRISQLEEELARRDGEHELARKVSAERQAELEASKRELDSSLVTLRLELASRVDRMNELEGELSRRDHEYEALRRVGEERYTELESEKAALKLSLDSLRHELSEEQGAKSDLASQLVRINELEEELSIRIRKHEAVQKSSEERAAEAVLEREHFESALEALRGELQGEQESRRDLERRLARMSELEEEVAGRDREIEDLRKTNEDRTIEAALEQERLEAAIESMRYDLRQEQEAKLEVENRLLQIRELEDEAEVWRREIEDLRGANAAVIAAAAAEKSRLDAEIAELVLARQVEVVSLTNALQEAKDKAAAEQEMVAALTRQVDTLREALQQTTEQQALEQASAMTALQEEVVALKGMVAELEKKAAVADGVVMVKGSHYLPGDVLKKWIGKEQ